MITCGANLASFPGVSGSSSDGLQAIKTGGGNGLGNESKVRFARYNMQIFVGGASLVIPSVRAQGRGIWREYAKLDSI